MANKIFSKRIEVVKRGLLGTDRPSVSSRLQRVE